MHNFSYFVDGAYPGPLVRGADGNFYGTTSEGTDTNRGTFYKITPEGTLTAILDTSPAPSQLVLGTDGNFYGASAYGAYNQGEIFRLTPAGLVTVLYSFCAKGLPCSDGDSPGALVLAADGNFYGLCTSGGNSMEMGHFSR